MCDCEVAEEESEATELELVLWNADAVVDAEEVCCGWVNGGGRCCLDCLESIASIGGAGDVLFGFSFRYRCLVLRFQW